MSKSHHTTPHYTTGGCYHTLTIAIFPVAIYVLQLFGKVSMFATAAAGLLVVLKMLVEWRHHRRHDAVPRPPVAASHLVRVVQAPVAGCYLCQELRPLRPAEIGGHRVGICQDCYHCSSFSSQYI